MKFNLLIFISTFLTIYTYAQNQRFNNGQMPENGSIKGTVIDSASGQTIEYSNFVLYKKRDSSLVTGTVTSSDGSFLLDKLRPGSYYARVTFIGYKKKNIDSIFISPKQWVIDLGTIKIVPTSLNMKDVVVTGERDIFTNSLDKKIINVDKNLVTAGGTALDVMENIPSVTVDADGGVSLRGNSNVNILIDGKPSGLAGISSSDVLTQIPASSIDRVELVTNPSARYDPEGTAGIINVVLKKRTNLGINGIASLNAGTGDKYNSSLNMNVRQYSFNLFGSYDARFSNSTGTGSSFRTTQAGSSSPLLDQTSVSRNKNNMHNVKAGVDYLLNDWNTLTFDFRFRNMNMTSSGVFSNKTFDNSSNLLRAYNRENDADRGVKSYEYSLSYKKTFEQKYRELTAEIRYSDNAMQRDENISQTEMNLQDPIQERNNSANTNKEIEIESNYIHPLGEQVKLEAGLDSEIEDLSMKNDYSTYNYSSLSFIPDLNKRNYFKYDEQKHAVYGIITSSIGMFQYQVGLRAEQMLTKIKLEGDPVTYKNDYFSVYPTIHLGFNFSQTDEIRLSYSRRVDRPNNRQLNPFVDYSDSLNISSGNPFLKPQYINSLEAGYITMLGITSLTSTLFFRQTNNLISTISRLENNGVVRSTFQNISIGRSYGLELIAAQQIFSWWRLNTNFSLFKAEIIDKGTLGGTSSSNSWTTKINSSFNMWEDIQLQIFANYNSPTILSGGGGYRGGGFGGSGLTAQTKMKEMFFMDAAVRKDFLDGRLAITFRVSDIFKTRKFDTETTGLGFYSLNQRRMDSRMFFLGISFKLDAKEKIRDRDQGEEDIDI